MASFNKAILIGNMTADPELKQTKTGTSVCSFSIAVQRRFAPENSEKVTDFFNIVTWRQTAEFVARYFKKGNPILVCGELQNRSYTDQSNVKHYVTEIIADEVKFTANKSDNENPGTPGTSASYTPSIYGAPTIPKFEDVTEDEDLPF